MNAVSGGLRLLPSVWYLIAILVIGSVLASIWANTGRGFDRLRHPQYFGLRVACVFPLSVVYVVAAIACGSLLPL
ncbi:MAG: hypothetical protein AAGA03_10965 [Planctomycetota bacterium]